MHSDASERGLGAVLTQDGHPIAYASRAWTNVQTRYAQIEKELLEVIFGLEKFHTFTYGRKVNVESDHKPLEVILKKPLYKAPKRLERMLMRAQLYQINLLKGIHHAYQPNQGDHELAKEEESINATQDIQFTVKTLEEIKEHTRKDEVLQELIRVIQIGWPEQKTEVADPITPYFGMRHELSIYDGIVVRGERVVISVSLRKERRVDCITRTLVL